MVILRIRLLLESEKYKFPAESFAIPLGPFSKALVPTPSLLPFVVVPTIVVTTPVGVILLILLLK